MRVPGDAVRAEGGISLRARNLAAVVAKAGRERLARLRSSVGDRTRQCFHRATIDRHQVIRAPSGACPQHGLSVGIVPLGADNRVHRRVSLLAESGKRPGRSCVGEDPVDGNHRLLALGRGRRRNRCAGGGARSETLFVFRAVLVLTSLPVAGVGRIECGIRRNLTRATTNLFLEFGLANLLGARAGRTVMGKTNKNCGHDHNANRQGEFHCMLIQALYEARYWVSQFSW